MARNHHRTLRNALNQLKRIWDELDYSQRRSLEIRTGIPGLAPRRASSEGSGIAQLEALYRARAVSSAFE